jgi:hypothetical protein
MSRKFTILFLTTTFLVALATLALTPHVAFAGSTIAVPFGNGPYHPTPPPKPPALTKGGGDPTKGLNIATSHPKPPPPPPKP